MNEYFFTLHHVSRYGLVLIALSLILLPCLFYYRLLVIERIQDFERQIRRAKRATLFNRMLFIGLAIGAGLMVYGSSLPTTYLEFGKQIGEREWSGRWDIEPVVQTFTLCANKQFQISNYKFTSLEMDAVSLKETGVYIARIYFYDAQQQMTGVIESFSIKERMEYGEFLEGQLIMLDSKTSFPATVSVMGLGNSLLQIEVNYACAQIRYEGSRKEKEESWRERVLGF